MSHRFRRSAMTHPVLLHAACLLTLAAAAGCTTGVGQPPPPARAVVAPAARPTGNDYRRLDNWLCRPGRNDACSAMLSAVALGSDATSTLGADPAAKVDCFYVYPTISL